MSGKESVVERYRAIVADLTPQDVASLWSAVLFGRQSFDDSLSGAITALQALRNDRAALAAERATLLAQKAEVAA